MSEEHNTEALPNIRDPYAPVNLGAEFEAAGIVVRDIQATLEDFDEASNTAASYADDDGMTALADVDPLARRPRTSSRVLCVVFALLLWAAAAGVWWLGVRTVEGQSYDDMVESSFATVLSNSGWLSVLLGRGVHTTVLIISIVIALVAALIAAIRKRWWLLVQLGIFAALCFASTFLKNVLPRTNLIHTLIEDPNNSAPSGHTTLAVGASLVLICAVSRGWRWVAALVGMAWSFYVGMSVIYGQWHRPTDVVMAVLVVGGLAMLMLAFTRASGMDSLGQRRSSAGVQIVGSVFITAGLSACLYASYVIWQIVPGLSMSANWAQSSSVLSSMVLMAGVIAVVCSLVLVMRQLTASPLSKIGLVGAPPAPPKSHR
ncbi:phosphatase PAP2 family protein [Bifidobacterium panos]|uniref:Phosphoesterase n=1 Tax=Bifidobacterium panos TaxID=2675321 RepID=A0ABX1SZ43_9BIFI|nr:phosphatase PAP2 family protein [Bifidobacterium sp. DSM 109963]NMN02066.1 phosphoesterase [Bifidobacterium sp. DSM 109963]